MDFAEKIRRFAAANPDVFPVYGGDGSLLEAWRRTDRKGRTLFPIRNYGLCRAHEALYSEILDGKRPLSGLPTCELDAVRMSIPGDAEFDPVEALSEIQFRTAVPTGALRFDLSVNGQAVYDNVIADGVICAAAKVGASGYWSSVTRTIFKEGFGVGFLSPTVGVGNLVLSAGDSVEIRLRREVSAMTCWDLSHEMWDYPEGTTIRFESAGLVGKCVGYVDFHCAECRKLRHGTTVVAQYLK